MLGTLVARFISAPPPEKLNTVRYRDDGIVVQWQGDDDAPDSFIPRAATAHATIDASDGLIPTPIIVPPPRTTHTSFVRVVVAPAVVHAPRRRRDVVRDDE